MPEDFFKQMFWRECDDFAIYLSNSYQFNSEIDLALIKNELTPFVHGWMFLYYGKN
jgi:hypothetical protein